MESSKDTGWSWVVLFAVFVTSVLSYGFLQSVGVFFVDWQEDFDASVQAVGWTSAVSLSGFGISGLVSSVISPYVSCRWQAFFGALLTSAALSCSPFCTHIGHVYAIMTLTGFGIGFIYGNCVVVLSYYFDKKLALANGIGLSGAAAGVLFLAPTIRYLNNEYSWRGAMLICSALLGNMCVTTSLFRLSEAEVISMAGIRPNVKDNPLKSSKTMSKNGINGNQSSWHSSARRRSSVAANNVRRHSVAFVQSYTNVLSIRFVMVNLTGAALLGFGYFTSLMFFVSNAIDLGVPKTDAAFLLSIFGICGVIGRLLYGPIIDRKLMSPFHMGCLLLGVAGTSCLLGSLARTYVQLVFFAVALGLSSSTFNVVFALIQLEVVGANYFKKTIGIAMIMVHTTSLLALPLMGAVEVEKHTIFRRRLKIGGPIPCIFPYCAFCVTALQCAFQCHIYDVTGDYRTSFYASGCAMYLNCIVILMDPVWKYLDRRRQRVKQRTNEIERKDIKLNARTEKQSGDDKESGVDVAQCVELNGVNSKSCNYQHLQNQEDDND